MSRGFEAVSDMVRAFVEGVTRFADALAAVVFSPTQTDFALVPSPMERAINDAEGIALVKAIHDRKGGL